MSKTKTYFVLLLLFLLLALPPLPAAPVGTLFTYQGRLANGINPANGSYDFQSALYDSATNGTRIGAVLTNAAVPVSNGLFTMALDFGPGAFTGEARWLQLAVATNQSSSFTSLSPRQLLTATPYALDAATVDTVAASHISGVLPDALLSTNVPLLGQSHVFTGSNLFQGPLILTNLANRFVGQFSGDGAGLTNLPPFTTVLTTNSSFAQIQSACARGGLIWFEPGHYYSISNLALTDNTVIFGWNAVLHASPGLTNFLIDESLNATNISIYGLGVTGDRYAAYTSPDFLSFSPLPDPYFQNNLINQGGLRLNMASGGTIAGCSAYGFGGYGFLLFSRNGSGADAQLGGFFHDNHAHDNGVGVAVIGPPYDYPGYPLALSNTWVNATAEHQLITGNEMFLNGIGLYAPGGNCLISANKITDNNYGILVSGGPNDTHGEIIGNSLNHNNYGIVASHMTGEVIRDNLFLDVKAIYIDTVGYLVFDGNQLIGSPTFTVTITNAPPAPQSLVTLSHNLYRGAWGTDVVVNTNFAAGSGAACVYGNHSTSISNNTDGSMISLMENGVGVTTNYTPLGGATFYITNGLIMKIQ